MVTNIFGLPTTPILTRSLVATKKFDNRQNLPLCGLVGTTEKFHKWQKLPYDGSVMVTETVQLPTKSTAPWIGDGK